jgi:hypothetical protein
MLGRGREGSAIEPVAGERSAGAQAAQTPPALTLSTECVCGHTRKYHRGLRMEFAGRCLECSCEEFTRARTEPVSSEQVMEEIRQGLNRVDDLCKTVASLCTRLSSDGWS